MDKLEAFESIRPVENEGKVTLVHAPPDKEDLTKAELAALKVSKVYLSAHPEGSDRGGYVPYVRFKDGSKIYYMELDGEWFD